MSYLNEHLLAELEFFDDLQNQTFKKIINYAINFIINDENQMKLNQFIEVSEEEGDRITNLALVLISSLVHYRPNIHDLNNQIKLIKLEKDKREFLVQKINDQIEQLRKKIFHQKLANLTNLKDLEWRFQIEVASKTQKNSFKPNILLNFKIENDNKMFNNLVNADFANLKNLQQNLQNAMKLHRSGKFKAARNSSI